MWGMLDIDSGCITLCITCLFTFDKHFVNFVSWFLLAISWVCTPTLNKAIIINNCSMFKIVLRKIVLSNSVALVVQKMFQ